MADGVTFNGREALTLEKLANRTPRPNVPENTELTQTHSDVTQLLLIYELIAPVSIAA